ncbi:MAG: isoprenylcysteine carboxylmethyltransferase family protein [Burkholderiales bacterium]
MDKLELRIPPPLIALAIGAAMWLLARLAPSLAFDFAWRPALSLLVAVSGGLLALAGIAVFWRVGTTIHPHHPGKTSSIVTSGVFKFTRNPMYLGLLLVLVSWAIRLANPLPFLLLAAFVWLINRLQIGPEERILSARFGQAYDDYRRSVRRWI